MRLVVLADTHLGSSGITKLPRALLRALERADLVLHAGDLTSAATYDELCALAPSVAVLGNNDVELVGRLHATVELELDGVSVAMIHDSGSAAGRERRLREKFPDAALVCFGHSHLPADQLGLGGQRLFNPGSPTQRRLAPAHTYGEIDLADGLVLGSRHVEV